MSGYVPPNFSEESTDAATLAEEEYGATQQEPGTPYIGPVAGIQNQLIELDPVPLTVANTLNFNIGALTPNVFIKTGSGEDAIQVSSGTNVLDGGEGSNFLTNGSGFDTDYVDDRAATSDIWSTLVNFHSGDNATVWGLTPESFMTNWVNNDGAVGSKGLTLHATSDTKPEASLTLTGYTTADLINGKLAVSYGTVDGNNYLNIHAN